MRPTKDAPKDPCEENAYADNGSPKQRHQCDFAPAPQPRPFLLLESLKACEIRCRDPEARSTEGDEEGG